MSFRIDLYLFVCVLAGTAVRQPVTAQTVPASFLSQKSVIAKTTYRYPALSFLKGPDTIPVKTVPRAAYLPFNFYSSHLGAACKMELKLEKQIRLPLRFRLGSKDQVDYLEGKNRH